MKCRFVSFAIFVSLLWGSPLKAQQPADPIVDALVPVVPLLATQTLESELMDYTVVTFGPRAILSPSFSTVRRLLDPPGKYPRAWREGVGGLARNYGNALASRTALETGRYASAALLHEDFRYRPSAGTNAFSRGLHALAFTFIDRSDSGGNRIAAANFIGAGAAGFVGMAYLPPGFNNLNHAETRTATAFAGFAAQNLLFEFAPELLKLKQKLRVPFAGSPVPKWWTKRN
jgi:hypothetical protein